MFALTFGDDFEEKSGRQFLNPFACGLSGKEISLSCLLLLTEASGDGVHVALGVVDRHAGVAAVKDSSQCRKKGSVVDNIAFGTELHQVVADVETLCKTLIVDLIDGFDSKRLCYAVDKHLSGGIVGGILTFERGLQISGHYGSHCRRCGVGGRGLSCGNCCRGRRHGQKSCAAQ